MLPGPFPGEWNFMSNVQRVGSAQGGPNIQLAYTVAGDPLYQTIAPANSVGEHVEQAIYSTTPYKSRRRPEHCIANNDTCKGWRKKGEQYCVGHLRSFGMLKPDDPHAPKQPKERS